MKSRLKALGAALLGFAKDTAECFAFFSFVGFALGAGFWLSTWLLFQ